MSQEPSVPIVRADLCWVQYLAGRYNDALETCDEILEENDLFLPALYYKARIVLETAPELSGSARVAQVDDAIELLMRARDYEKNSLLLGTIGYAHGIRGSEQQARTILKKMHEMEDAGGYILRVDLAIVYVGLEDYDKALKNLEEAYARADGGTDEIGTSPIFRPLRDSAMFKALLDKIGIAARGKSTTKNLINLNTLVCNCFMAMGGRNRRQRQKGLWVAAADLPQTAAHPFYHRLNKLLDEHGFDEFAEQRCEKFYAAHMGRPSLTAGSYFRCLLIGYFEGIDGERGIAWRLADSISLRCFLAIELDESTPDHSTISRTRRLIDVETHRQVFTWVLQLLAQQGLLKGVTMAVDATTLEANAALRSIVRRDSGESYEEFLKGLAAESGIETPSREQLAKLDKKRKNKGSNKDWMNPHDPDAKITKMKDGHTHLAHKAEHAVDLQTGVLLALTVQGADLGDTTTVSEMITAAAEQVAAVAQDPEANEQLSPQGLQEVAADKGYHSNDVLTDLKTLEMRSYINEPDRGRRN